MVKGLDRFREYFAGHEDGYALIGGAACDILFGEAGLPFRATKDFDIVLCVEVVSVEFGTVFADFLEAGGYRACHHWSKDLNTDTEGGTAQAETTRAFAKSFAAQDKLRMTTLEGGQNDRRGEGNAQNPQAAWNCRPWLIGCEPTGSCRCPSRLSVTPVVQPPVSFSRVPTR